MAINLTIGKFIETAAKRDFARNNLFRVVGLNARNLTLSEEDLVYAKGGQIPGRSTPVATVQYMGMNMPYTKSTVSYDGNESYTIDFYLDAKGELPQKFERASREAFNDLTSTGDWRFPNINNTMTIAMLDINLEPIEYITFYGVSFTKIGEVTFQSSEGDGAALSCQCTFSYIYYKRTGSDHVFAGVNS